MSQPQPPNQPYQSQPSYPTPPPQFNPQQSPPQQGYSPIPGPQAPPAFNGPQGQLILNLRKPFGLGSAAMISPAVWIDGFKAPAQWGQNSYPAPAGRRHVIVEQTYMWNFGRTETTVDLQPEQAVEVHYSGPVFVFLKGRFGSEVQPRPGFAAFWLIMGIPLLVLLITIIAVIVASMS